MMVRALVVAAVLAWSGAAVAGDDMDCGKGDGPWHDICAQWKLANGLQPPGVWSGTVSGGATSSVTVNMEPGDCTGGDYGTAPVLCRSMVKSAEEAAAHGVDLNCEVQISGVDEAGRKHVVKRACDVTPRSSAGTGRPADAMLLVGGAGGWYVVVPQATCLALLEGLRAAGLKGGQCFP